MVATCPRGPIIVAAGTVVGDMEGREPVLRSGARPGHKIVHTGNLGASARGYQLIQAGKTGKAVRLFLRPEPPVNRAVGVGATAMTRTSRTDWSETAAELQKPRVLLSSWIPLSSPRPPVPMSRWSRRFMGEKITVSSQPLTARYPMAGMRSVESLRGPVCWLTANKLMPWEAGTTPGKRSSGEHTWERCHETKQ